jgi:hypothetical protein
MITITGTVGSSGKYLVTGIPVDTTANAVLKIAPPWNGPWFRRQGFTTMPESEVGAGLLAVLTQHASFPGHAKPRDVVVSYHQGPERGTEFLDTIEKLRPVSFVTVMD